MKRDKFLPIGSVVLLKEGSHRLMIIGYCSTESEKSKKVYDYISCFFPEGILKLNEMFCFNHEDIKEIFYIGYSDNVSKEFNKALSLFMKSYVDSDGNLLKTPSELMQEINRG